MPQRATFIAFDGLDGAGKSTQLNALRDHLHGRGLRVTERNLGSASGFVEVLAALKRRKEVASRRVRELIYYFEATFAGLEILDTTYDVVLADRHLLTYYTFGQLHGWSRQEILYFTRYVPVPDLTVVLDIPPAVAAQRILATRGSFDIAELGYVEEASDSQLGEFLLFQERVRHLMAREGHAIGAAFVDGSQPVDDVRRVVARLADRFV